MHSAAGRGAVIHLLHRQTQHSEKDTFFKEFIDSGEVKVEKQSWEQALHPIQIDIQCHYTTRR